MELLIFFAILAFGSAWAAHSRGDTWWFWSSLVVAAVLVTLFL